MADKCSKCTVVFSGNDLIAKCYECSLKFHPACTRTVNFTKSKNKSWKCDNCESASAKSADDQNGALLEAINSIKIDINANLDKRIGEVTASITGLTGELSNLSNKLSSLESSQVKLEERCSLLEDKNKKMEAEIVKLELQMRDAEQHARCANLEITGLPRTANEDVYACLESIAAVLNVPFNRDEVSMAHRLRLYSSRHAFPPIIAQFVSRRVRDTWLAAAKRRKGLSSTEVSASLPPSQVYLNEQLTPYNKSLLGRARGMVKAGKILSANYTNGKILIKASAGSDTIRIQRHEELDRHQH